MLCAGCKEQTKDEKDFKIEKSLSESGSYQAYFNLGMHYEKGIGVELDDEKAIECYKRGLENVWAEQNKLPTTLEGWKRLAAKSDYNSREKFLIGAYYEGLLQYGNIDIQITDDAGVFAENKKEAEKWYKDATKNRFHSDCMDAYVRLYEISDNDKSARHYLEFASQNGSAWAKTLLSEYYLYDNKNYYVYENGSRQVAVNASRPVSPLLMFLDGVKLLEEAAEIGGSYAAGSLYWIYINYEGKYPIQRNEAKAWMYRRKDDEQSTAASECQIQFLDYNRVPKLASMLPYYKEWTKEAFQLRIGALQGDPKAQYSLSVYYAYGKVFPKDTAESVRLCKKSAALGYPLALMSLGNRYYDGNGVIKDEIEAYACWNLAGCENKKAHDYVVKVEEKMTESARLLGQKRSRELQAEIEANKSGKRRK